MDERAMAQRIAEKVSQKGGRAYFVGGCVRDKLMGRENKDLDIEIHGLSSIAVESILDTLGERQEVGKSFGVYLLKGYDIDIALPRREKAVGAGHRDFEVRIDPKIGTEKAAKRRDFTMNAMMEDVLTGEIVDHFSGRQDLAQGILRHVNDSSFGEDPLRVLRAAQFAARFGFSVAEETIAICRTMKLGTLSKERVFEELKKALLQAEKPSIFFETLFEMEAMDVWFLEVLALRGIKQNVKYHPEGDVWSHTMMVLDAAAERRHLAKSPLALMLGALVHDFGKIVVTKEIDGVFHAYHHEVEGLPLIRKFLKRLTQEKELVREVLNLAELHMRPNMLAGDAASVKATNKMFDLAMVPEDLILLALCDNAGKGMDQADTAEGFLRDRLRIFYETVQKPYVEGKDLQDAGILPGAHYGELLAYAHKLRLAGVEKEAALKQTLAYGREKKLI